MMITQDIFLEAYDKYKSTVYSVIFNYVKNTDDTKDLQQETFIRLLRCEKEFNDWEHIKAWLIKVSANLSKNLLKSKSYTSEIPLPETLSYKMTEEDVDIVNMVLALPEKYRIPVHLHYFEDYSVKQIAEVLEAPESTIKVRLKRGREKLKKVLQKENLI